MRQLIFDTGVPDGVAITTKGGQTLGPAPTPAVQAAFFAVASAFAALSAFSASDDGQPNWGRVLDRVCNLEAQVRKSIRGSKKQGPPRLERAALLAGLKVMAPGLRQVAEQGEAMGIEPGVLNHLRPHILARAAEMAALA